MLLKEGESNILVPFLEFNRRARWADTALWWQQQHITASSSFTFCGQTWPHLFCIKQRGFGLLKETFYNPSGSVIHEVIKHPILTCQSPLNIVTELSVFSFLNNVFNYQQNSKRENISTFTVLFEISFALKVTVHFLYACPSHQSAIPLLYSSLYFQQIIWLPQAAGSPPSGCDPCQAHSFGAPLCAAGENIYPLQDFLLLFYLFLHLFFCQTAKLWFHRHGPQA